jgi:hypothetical protein
MRCGPNSPLSPRSDKCPDCGDPGIAHPYIHFASLSEEAVIASMDRAEEDQLTTSGIGNGTSSGRR